MAVDTKKRLQDSAEGYAFCFDPKVSAYGSSAAQVILDALKAVRFTGRCEYYAGDAGATYGYAVGIGLRFSARPPGKWWLAFRDAVASCCAGNEQLDLDPESSEFSDLRSLRSNFLYRGAVEFSDGTPRLLLDECDSWFIDEARERLPAGG